MSNELKGKDVNALHTVLWNPLEVITAIGKVIGLELTGTFEPDKVCAWGRLKRLR